MKPKTSQVKEPSAEEQMLEKRDSLLSQRDEFLVKVAEMDNAIASLDSVIAMFNPRHVPLDIRRAQNATPVLTLTAQPMFKEEEGSVTPDPKPTAKGNGKATKSTKAAAAAPKPAAKQTKAATKTQQSAPRASANAEDALKEAVAERAAKKPKVQTKGRKLMDAARDELKSYFAEIDKLKTLTDIVTAEPEGVPFRKVRDDFLAKHPLDISSPERKKVFSDRLSSILYSMSKQGVVERAEKIGPDGKDNFWVPVDRSSSASAQEDQSAAA